MQWFDEVYNLIMPKCPFQTIKDSTPRKTEIPAAGIVGRPDT